MISENLLLKLDNGVEIDLSVNCGLYNGIAQARLDGEVFLVAGNGNKPYFCTPEGVIYQIFHYRNTRHEGQKIIIGIDAEGIALPVEQNPDMFLFPRLAQNGSNVTDRLEMIIEPQVQQLNGETYRGFLISYNFNSESRAIHSMLESVAIAPGGNIENIYLMEQHLTTNFCRLEEKITRDSFYSNEENYGGITCIQSPCRGGGSQLFNIIQGNGIATVTYFAKPDTLKSAIITRDGEDFVTVSDFHYQKLSNNFSTQPRAVLATAINKNDTRAGRINRWTAWYDYTTELWQKDLGIRPTATLPAIAFDGTGGAGVDPGCTYPELLTVWADRMDYLREKGIRGIILHTPEWLSAANQPTLVFGGNNCTPFRYQLSDHLGGNDGLRDFCDAAHQQGIKVYIWISGHLSIEAPIWKEHPEWVVRNHGNLIWDGHYHTIHAMSFVHGAQDWLLADLKDVREATGADGIWFDSFTNLALQAINYQSPGYEPNAPGVLKFLGSLSDMGYEVMIECMSQLGVSSWGASHGKMSPQSLYNQEDMIYNTCLRTYLDDWQNDPGYSESYYFKSLAARAPLGVWIREYMGNPAAFPLALPAWYAPLNNAYSRVENKMRYREVLEDGLGVIWYDENRQPSALFALRDGEYEFSSIAVDLMNDDVLTGDAKIISNHIYCFTDAD